MANTSFVVLAGFVSAASLSLIAGQGAAPPAAPVAGAPAAQGAAPPAGQAPAGRGPAPLQSPNAHYVSVTQTIDVAGPVDKVWARIGKYCDIGEWGGFAGGCTITSGKDGELGAVRTVGSEILVGKTEHSYTYTQPVRTTGIYNMYHGTLEAKALTPTTTQLVYSLVMDNSLLADDAARETSLANYRTRVNGWLQNMKILAEGGTLPARGRGAAGR